MKNYVICFDFGYDNKFIEVEAKNEKEALKVAKEVYINNYGDNLSKCFIDVEEI